MNELISREEAVKAALEFYHTLKDRRDACMQTKDVGGVMVWTAAAEIAQAMVRRLMELPGVEAEPVRHGRWEFIRRYGSTRPYHCSCGYASPVRFPYCPCCGTWMDGGDGPAAE